MERSVRPASRSSGAKGLDAVNDSAPNPGSRGTSNGCVAVPSSGGARTSAHAPGSPILWELQRNTYRSATGRAAAVTTGGGSGPPGGSSDLGEDSPHPP